MKHNQKRARRRRRRILAWDLEKALSALPYLSSILRSLREHRLEAMEHHLKVQRLAQRPGRPDRETLVAQAEAQKAAQEAERQYREAQAELQALDVYCADPIAGLAFIPFVHNEQLAWYVYDLFEPNTIRSWRYHADPLTFRRMLTVTL